MITALLIGAGALYLLRKKHAQAIGKVERIKRRIYKEVSLAQQEGVDFSKKFPELTTQERSALERVGKDVGWKQSKRSIESGKPYVESYYGSLRRAWNAVSGIAGIGATAYDVRDTNNNVVLTWYDVTDHIQHEPEAKTLLALPPHVEEKKTKAKKASKAKDEEEMQRAKFAHMFLMDYIEDENLENGGKGWAGVEIDPALVCLLKRDYTKDGKTVKVFDLIYWAWVNKKYKINKGDNNVKFVSMLDGVWYDAPLWRQDGIVFKILDDYYKIYKDDAGWREHADELDDIRKDLLDRAKLMIVHTDLDHGTVDENGVTQPIVKGDDRYNYLDWINYIVFAHQKYDRGGDTYYPIVSFENKEDAEFFSKGRKGTRVIPVWDVPIEKITGLN